MSDHSRTVHSEVITYTAVEILKRSDSSDRRVLKSKKMSPGWKQSCRGVQCLQEDRNGMGINLVLTATAGGRAEGAACPCQGGIWLPLCLLCKCDPFYFSPVSHIRLVFVTQSRDTGCRSCPATAQLGPGFGFSSFNPVITFHIKFVLGWHQELNFKRALVLVNRLSRA